MIRSALKYPWRSKNDVWWLWLDVYSSKYNNKHLYSMRPIQIRQYSVVPTPFTGPTGHCYCAPKQSFGSKGDMEQFVYIVMCVKTIVEIQSSHEPESLRMHAVFIRNDDLRWGWMHWGSCLVWLKHSKQNCYELMYRCTWAAVTW